MKRKIYIGWDSREPKAYDVARNSILKRAKNPKDTQVFPLEIDNLKDLINRPVEKREDGSMWCPISQAPVTTEFAISRFLIPFLTKGWALFIDPDVVCLADIEELFSFADDKYAVMVVKHEHKAKEGSVKGLGIQTAYPRKNWSSVVLWNCDHPANKKLTLEMINTLPGRDLHAFRWLEDEEIGELPREWNYLIGVNKYKSEIKIAHYTLGGPWIPGWEPQATDNIWNDEIGI